MRITRQVTAALSLAVLVAVCSLVGVTSSSARPLADGLVRIRVLLDESGRGVLMVEGAISD